MSAKRSAEEARPGNDERKVKKQKRGFHVGPDNLPDGQWKRKNQQIKRDLISQAKLKKDYAKIKARQEAAEAEAPSANTSAGTTDEAQAVGPHPDRQTLIDRQATSPEPDPAQDGDDKMRQRQRQRRPKPTPFAREQKAADEARARAEERRAAREEGQRQRTLRLEERERFRRAMAKARSGGRNGQRKLGRESAVLLEKVKRMVGV